MSRTTWRDVLRDDPSDISPPSREEAGLMMRAAFLQASGYPEAVRDMIKTWEESDG